MTPKEKQKTRGYLNYYLAFSGKVHSIVNRTFLEPDEGKIYLYALMEEDKIRFRDPEEPQPSVIYSDATRKQIRWCTEKEGAFIITEDLPIIFTEILGALIGIYKLISADKWFNLNFYIHFLFVSICCKAKRLAKIEEDKRRRSVTVVNCSSSRRLTQLIRSFYQNPKYHEDNEEEEEVEGLRRISYVNTKLNPADEWSRKGENLPC